jgi:hypothetical protein
MADDTIVSTTVPETVTVDTGVDAKTLGNLNKEFSDFWAEQDATPSQTDAPPAPDESGAGQETPPAKQPEPKQPEPTPKAGEPPPSKPPEAKQWTDEEIDKLSLPARAGQPPEMQADFKQIKGFWKADRARLKAIEAQQAQLQAELAAAKTNSWTPEQKADYEHAVSIRRKFDFTSDPEFVKRYQAPIQERFGAVLQEAVSVLPDQSAARAWAEHIIANYPPDKLSKSWWLNDVIAKVPNELERQALLASVTDLLKLQRERDGEVQRRTSDKNSFEAWQQEKNENTNAWTRSQIMAEIGEQERRLQEVLPRDIEQAKTPEERAAIEAHNERWQRLNGQFVEHMQDIGKNGPKAWVRASVAATRGMYIEEQYKALEEEFKTVRAERDQLRKELDKIAGVRRKISNTTGTPPASTLKRDGNGLSIKNLDVRKSFDTFWQEQDRGGTQ